MSGAANFPTGLDDDTSLYDVTDNVTPIIAAHHNNIKEAVKLIERKIGIDGTAGVTTIDYRLGNPTGSHKHDGASGNAGAIDPTTILIPSGGFPSGGHLYDHLMSPTLHSPSGFLATGIASVLSPGLIFVPTTVTRRVAILTAGGSLVVASNRGMPVSFARTMMVEGVRANLRVGPSGATTAADVRFGPTSLWAASVNLRPIFAPGATDYGHASPNLVTYPSGAIITLGVDVVGSNDPGQDLSVSLVFRE